MIHNIAGEIIGFPEGQREIQQEIQCPPTQSKNLWVTTIVLHRMRADGLRPVSMKNRVLHLGNCKHICGKSLRTYEQLKPERKTKLSLE